MTGIFFLFPSKVILSFGSLNIYLVLSEFSWADAGFGRCAMWNHSDWIYLPQLSDSETDPGVRDPPSLQYCKDLCENHSECRAISYNSTSWCYLWRGGTCEKIKFGHYQTFLVTRPGNVLFCLIFY